MALFKHYRDEKSTSDLPSGLDDMENSKWDKSSKFFSFDAGLAWKTPPPQWVKDRGNLRPVTKTSCL
jgi:hypothetical protein